MFQPVRSPDITQPILTKFDHIVQKLPQKIMVSVRSLIMGSAASSETPYEDLKAKLVSSYTLSRWQKVSKLIHHPGLGDRGPTALMDAMLALLPEDEKPGCLFQGLFLERLPFEMRDQSPGNSKTLVKWCYTPTVCGTPGKLYLPTTS